MKYIKNLYTNITYKYKVNYGSGWEKQSKRGPPGNWIMTNLYLGFYFGRKKKAS